MTAVDRANLDLVLPQIAAQHTFVRPASTALVYGGQGWWGADRQQCGLRAVCWRQPLRRMQSCAPL